MTNPKAPSATIATHSHYGDDIRQRLPDAAAAFPSAGPPPVFSPAEAIGDVQPEDDDEDRYPQTEEEEAAQTFADQTDQADGRHEEIGQDEAEDGQDVEAKIQ
ncbi:hypothetical protein [Parascardovia denticolens]|uniref:hypothetical protein n=1 Tax=Parascardovia denticolens TaxID=78258 RepID=UPI001CBA66D4|nr:hypothetical protein [Parascardovia denticolens]